MLEIWPTTIVVIASFPRYVVQRFWFLRIKIFNSLAGYCFLFLCCRLHMKKSKKRQKVFQLFIYLIIFLCNIMCVINITRIKNLDFLVFIHVLNIFFNSWRILAVDGRQATSWPCQKERKERHTNPISLRLFLVRVEKGKAGGRLWPWGQWLP